MSAIFHGTTSIPTIFVSIILHFSKNTNSNIILTGVNMIFLNK
nr:MAG TPA: hypothetical protein [Caudoviricetes sp.]